MPAVGRVELKCNVFRAVLDAGELIGTRRRGRDAQLDTRQSHGRCRTPRIALAFGKSASDEMKSRHETYPCADLFGVCRERVARNNSAGRESRYCRSCPCRIGGDLLIHRKPCWLSDNFFSEDQSPADAKLAICPYQNLCRHLFARLQCNGRLFRVQFYHIRVVPDPGSEFSCSIV